MVIGRTFAAADSAALVLVAPGTTPPDIFIDLRATPAEKLAAHELRDFLEKISGQRLSIRTDYWIKAPPPGPFIAVGRSRFTEDIGTQDLGAEQYVIDVTPQRLAIVGDRERQRGVLYGVYDVLEQLGVRWFRPEPWGEHVPQQQTIALPLGRRVANEPAYAYRSVVAGGFTRNAEATLDQSEAVSLWALRQRLNGPDPGSDPRHGGQRVLRFDHIYYQLIPVETYFDQHPEYFCLYKGERRRVSPDGPVRPDNPTGLQLCLSNPGLQELFAQRIIEQARGRNDLAETSYSVTPNDACPFCECDACREMDDPRQPAAMSNRVCTFTNIVARKVAAAVPGARLSLNAYSAWTDPPTLVERMEPNVVIHIALINGWSDYTKRLDDPEPNWNRTAAATFAKWQALGVREIYTYEYWSGYGWPGPLPIARTIADRLQHYRALNIRGVYNETHPSWGPQGLEHYLCARLLWNPDLDVDQELESYYSGYYGPAATPMRAYHEAWMQAFGRHAYPVYSGGRGMHLLMTPALIAATGAHLDEAGRLISGHTLYEQRLRGVVAGHELAAGISNVLRIKKETGQSMPVPGNRGSYLRSPAAEAAFARLLDDTYRRNTGAAIFDMRAEPPYFWYLDGDVLRNDALGHEHESELLKDF
ncbi:MAG: DUF4838 domain-containing protein [Planctomycetaceae bacterium]